MGCRSLRPRSARRSEIVPADAGVLVPPGDANALRDALRRVIEDADARARMAEAAREGAKRLPQWRQSAAAFARVLERADMSGFSAEWLALREPLDHARAQCRRCSMPSRRHSRTGTRSPSSISAAAPARRCARSARGCRERKRWKLVDNDPVLLAEAFATARPAGAAVETQQFDLNGDVGPLFDEGAELVTASALIDLVSEPWLANFAAAAAARSLPVYIALTYDGRASFSERRSATMRRSFPQSMRISAGNKGFGPALGPRAAESAKRIFRALGYSIVQGQSDWVAEATDAKFQIELLAGWLHAAREMGELSRDTLEGWFTRRCDAVAAGKLTLTVGHVDFFAQPRKR